MFSFICLEVFKSFHSSLMHNENTHFYFFARWSCCLKLVVLNCSVHPYRRSSAINPGWNQLNFVICQQCNNSVNCYLLIRPPADLARWVLCIQTLTLSSSLRQTIQKSIKILVQGGRIRPRKTVKGVHKELEI